MLVVSFWRQAYQLTVLTDLPNLFGADTNRREYSSKPTTGIDATAEPKITDWPRSVPKNDRLAANVSSRLGLFN